MSAEPRVCRSVSEFRQACDDVRASGRRLGFVPTMGALHAGHLRLVASSRERAGAVAVSIFVNPTQFGPNEDLARYPRDLVHDVALLSPLGVELVFSPSADEMYPPGERTRVTVGELGDHLCGPLRPGHFQGVATIVAKLFAVAGPSVAVFGRKDYQQLKIIERMARDLMLPVEVVGEPTVRDPDGLALSSRNAYLSSDERLRALSIPRALGATAQAFGAGERDTSRLLDVARSSLAGAGLRVEYLELADPDRLSPLSRQEPVRERALLAVAAFCGATRLIDNLVLGEDPAPTVPEPR